MKTILLAVVAATVGAAVLQAQSTVPTPASVTKVEVGADRTLADWSQVTRYFAALAAASPAVRVDTLGPTTEKRPFIVATISTPENIARLTEIRRVQAMLADPRTLDARTEATAIEAQPAVIVISCNIHATEIAASQMSMELAYRLATNDTLQRELRNVVVLLIPSMNPDGEQLVTEWYRGSVGTKWEGGPLPWLYHHYVGHDNNRDWYMITQQETRLVSRLLYQTWFPEIFYDVHQQGSFGMRMTVPPHVDPIDPFVDPIIVRGINQIGATMSWALESRGKSGVGDAATYDLWWHGGARSAPTRHNMVGLLTEAASVKIASPITITPTQLTGHSRGLPRYERRVNFPNPWPGGTWRLRDIMDYELISSEALVKLASDQRGDYVRNFVALGKKAIAAGHAAPYAYRVSAGRDPEAARALLEALRRGGIEMGTIRGDSDVVIPLAQPYRAHVMDLFEVQRFPKMERYPGGPVEKPYDVAGWTLPLQMGVTVTAVDSALTAPLAPITTMTPEFPPAACAAVGSGRYASLSASDTRSYGLIAGALAARRPVRVTGSGATARFVTELPHGAEVVGCPPTRVAAMPAGATLSRLPRIALYKPWTGNIDEGWTRFVLEREHIPFVALTDSMVRAGKLRDLYDVILVPDMSFREIHDGMSPAEVPPRYAGGLGDGGVAALRTFAHRGGTLVLLDRASELATSALGVAVGRITVPRQRDDEEDAPGAATSLYAPGSILRVLVDGSRYVARGMSDTAAVYFTNSVTFDVPAGSAARVIARYPERESDILLSGYLQGGSAIAGKAAAVEVPVGSGRVVMFGFRVQYRGQSYGTFKLLFNALLGEGDSTMQR